jgi:hypothetical protein
MDPATAIIKKLGGEARVAGIAGTALSAPYRWQHEKSRGDCRDLRHRLLRYLAGAPAVRAAPAKPARKNQHRVKIEHPVLIRP